MTKLQLKYRELKIISVIAASENISHAATVLGIAQANVSKYLADFESKVGLKVFDRTTRQLMLTPLAPRCYRTSTTCWIETSNLIILLQIISMRNVVGSLSTPQPA